MELTAPLHVHWEITNACNLRCLHCYQQDDSIRTNQLSRDELFSIAKKIIEAGVFQITLTGGEPFMVECLPELVAYFNASRIVPHITSNGTLINESIIRWLLSVKATIQISLDSHIPETHNHIRQHPKSYELATQAIDLLCQHGIPVTLAFCATKKNYQDLEGIIQLAIQRKVDILMIGEVLPFYGQETLQQSLSFSPIEYKTFVNAAVELRRKYHPQIDIRINSEWGFVFSDEVEHSPCTAMDRDMAILYDGQAYPCPFIRSKLYSMGNLLKMDIKSIWKSRKAIDFRSQKHQGCTSSCRYYRICKSGCKALLANQGGAITNRDPRCPISE